LPPRVCSAALRKRVRVIVELRDDESVCLCDPVGELICILVGLRNDEPVDLGDAVGQLIRFLIGLIVWLCDDESVEYIVAELVHRLPCSAWHSYHSKRRD
jgi:hypothetical protein